MSHGNCHVLHLFLLHASHAVGCYGKCTSLRPVPLGELVAPSGGARELGVTQESAGYHCDGYYLHVDGQISALLGLGSFGCPSMHWGRGGGWGVGSALQAGSCLGLALCILAGP